MTRHNYPSQGQTFKFTSKQKLACIHQQSQHKQGTEIYLQSVGEADDDQT